MKWFTLIAALLSTGCGRQGSWPAEVDEFVRSYSDMSRHHGAYVDKIEWVTIQILDKIDSDQSVVGMCWTGDNKIQLKRSAWDRYSWHSRQELVFHELGHCVHDRDHRLDLDPTTRWPVSLMYPYMLRDYQYQQLYDRYNQELFTGRLDLSDRPVITCKDETDHNE
jgi:hypothetical protein